MIHPCWVKILVLQIRFNDICQLKQHQHKHAVQILFWDSNNQEKSKKPLWWWDSRKSVDVPFLVDPESFIQLVKTMRNITAFEYVELE